MTITRASGKSGIVVHVSGEGGCNGVSSNASELADRIKNASRRSARDLPGLLEEAQVLADHPENPPFDRAVAHRAAANAHQMLNQFEPALARYDAAIALLEQLQQPEELGRTYHAKVGLLNFMRRYDELFACADRARAIFEALHDTHRLARLDANLSHAYNRLNRFDLVLQFSERALPVLEAAGDPEGVMVALTNSAVALMLMNNFEEAEQRYTRGLALAENKGWPVWAWSCRYNVAYMQYLRGNANSALAEFRRLIDLYREAGEQRLLCQCHLNEAEILVEIGEAEGAAEAARKGELLARELDLQLETGRSLVLQAAAGRMKGREETSALITEAMACFGRERNTVWAAIARLRAIQVQEDWASDDALEQARGARELLKDTGLLGRLALADITVGRILKTRGETDGALKSFQSALLLAEKGRSDWMGFHAAHQTGALLEQRNPQAAKEHLQRAESKLDYLWNQLGSDDLKLAFLGDRETVYAPLVRLASTESAEAALEFADKARSRVLRETLGAPAPQASRIAGALSDDECLVEYFVSGPDVLAFVVERGNVHLLSLTNAVAEVGQTLENLERHIQGCQSGWERMAPARAHHTRTVQTHLARLYQLLLEPAAALLRQRIVVVPHGLLHRVPFQALRTNSGDLIDTHEVRYCPSAALYGHPPASNPSESALFIAFTSGAGTGGQENSAEEEVRTAAAAMGRGDVWVDPTKDELAELFATPHALVHIAGHAGIDPVGGTLSWIETRSGKLTQQELSRLSLKARTIVITGCQTARRTIRPGDEWQGLMRAFYLAGAEFVVSALWDIRDESAVRFASNLYNNGPAANTVPAVDTAMKRVREWRDHPYFWGGFSTFVSKRRLEGTYA